MMNLCFQKTPTRHIFYEDNFMIYFESQIARTFAAESIKDLEDHLLIEHSGRETDESLKLWRLLMQMKIISSIHTLPASMIRGKKSIK